MATKLIAESLDLTDAYNFTGTLQQNGAGIGGANTPYFQASVGSDISLTGSTLTALTFSQEYFDTANLYDTSTGKFTMDSANAGKYYINARISIDVDTDFSSTGNYMYCQLRHFNSSDALQTTHTFTQGFSTVYWPHASVSGIFNLANGDYVQAYAKLTASGHVVIGSVGMSYTGFQGFKLIT